VKTDISAGTVQTALGPFAADHDVAQIAGELLSRGYDDLDIIPTDEFWEVVKCHAITG